MIKINAAWFNRTERGTFAGIFGFMIQSGQFAINILAPFILAGFAIGTWTIGQDEWRWLFRIPPLVTAFMAVLVVLIPKETPEEAGYPGLIHDELSPGDTGTRVSIRESFVTIFTHPLVWFYAAAYACTGAVRNSSDQLAMLYFVEQLHLDIVEKAGGGFLDDVPDAARCGLRFTGFGGHFGQIFQRSSRAGGHGPLFPPGH